jgi:integrase
MARIVKPLTDKRIKHAKPTEKEYNLADGQGLFLRIKPNGSKLWLFNYLKPYIKKRSNLSLGSYPDLSLNLARQERAKYRQLLAQNVDPSEHRALQAKQHQEAHNLTLSRIFDDWLKVKRSQVVPNTAKDIQASFNLHILPTLGNVPVHKLTVKQAIKTLKPIEAKGSLETVKRLCQRMNEVMTFAVHTDLIVANPLISIRSAFGRPKKKNLPTLSPNQLPGLMAKLNQASIRRTTRCLFEWQLHTMVRPSEAAGTCWDEIHLEKKLWIIPADRMKGKREHIVPLTQQAIGLLKTMEPISSNRTHVFPSEITPRNPTNPQTVNMALKRMNFGGQLVAHGLRAIASTTLHERGHDPQIIEAALAHRDQNETHTAYNRSNYLEGRIALMNTWSEIIEKASLGSLSISASLNDATPT